MLIYFTNFSAEILPHVLGYSVCAEHHNSNTFLPNSVNFKSIENYMRKSCSSLAPNVLVILTLNLCQPDIN